MNYPKISSFSLRVSIFVSIFRYKTLRLYLDNEIILPYVGEQFTEFFTGR
jgi:hypothetical protein